MSKKYAVRRIAETSAEREIRSTVLIESPCCVLDLTLLLIGAMERQWAPGCPSALEPNQQGVNPRLARTASGP